MNLDDTLAARRATHGDFSDMAEATQDHMRLVMASQNWNHMTDAQKEALHMILHKLARICYGDPGHIDSWQDIAGYAQLITKRLENESL